MMQEEVYSITNLDGYVSDMREVAASNLSENSHNDNLDEYISLNQMINLVKQNCIGFDMQNNPILNNTANEKIFEETTVWIHNVGLAKLAAKDLIECAWDDEINEMVFWHKETPKNESSKSKPKRKRKNSQ
jgi:hypothetical protein